MSICIRLTFFLFLFSLFILIFLLNEARSNEQSGNYNTGKRRSSKRSFSGAQLSAQSTAFKKRQQLMRKLAARAGPVTDRLAREASQAFDERDSEENGEFELGKRNLETREKLIPWWYKNMTSIPDPFLRRGTHVYFATTGVTLDWCKNREYGDPRASTMIFQSTGSPMDTICVIEEDI